MIDCHLGIHIYHTLLATGKVLDYIWRNDKQTGKPEIIAIIVKFDDEQVGQQMRKENMHLSEVKKYPNGVPIFKVKHAYKSTRRQKTRKTGRDLYIRQFPLVLSFASTGNNENIMDQT